MNRSFVPAAPSFYRSPPLICIIVVSERGTFQEEPMKRCVKCDLLWKIFNLPPGDWRSCASCLTRSPGGWSHSCLISLTSLTLVSVRSTGSVPGSGFTLGGSVQSKLRSTPRSSITVSGVRQGSSRPAVTAVLEPAVTAVTAAGVSVSPVSMLTGISITHGRPLPLDAENITEV